MTETGPEANRTKKILFICTANICRSPMAEAIFNALISETDMPYEARSAGVAALTDEPITPHVVAVLEEAGVEAGTHRARQVNEDILEEADLVLTMSPWHLEKLRRDFAGYLEKTHTLLEYVNGAPDREGISDPYGQSITTYRASMRRIFECVDVLVARLKEEKGFLRFRKDGAQ